MRDRAQQRVGAVMLLDKLRTLLGLARSRPGAAPPLQPVIDEVASAWPFTEAAVDLSPDAPGVFLLYSRGRLIFIGAAVNGSGIRQELMSHLRGAHGSGTRAATAFTWQAAAQPLALHRAYLEAHRARYGGRLPPANPERG